jgi:hypothetical protein
LEGVAISAALLAFIGFTVGIASGFIGVGGGYMLTPALIIFGFPANFAVGTGLAYILGNSIVAFLRHRKLGNVDIKLGGLMICGTLVGIELGVRLLNGLKEMGLVNEVVLAASLAILSFMAVFTFWETRRSKRKMDEIMRRGEKVPRDIFITGLSEKMQRIEIPPMIYFPKSRCRISLLVILGVGLLTGVLVGFMGVGGGFVIVPCLIYLIGVPSIIAVGTSLFQIIISAGFGAARHTMSGNVVIFASVIMILGACVGTQVGTLATRLVRGPSVRFVLGYSMFFGAIAIALELASVLTADKIYWLGQTAKAFIICQMFLLVGMILALLIMALMSRRGHRIPKWAQSLVIKD